MKDKSMREDYEIEIDLLELLRELKKRIAVIVLAVILGAGISGAITYFLIVPIYSSTTQLYVLSKSTSVTQLADLQIGTSLTRDYVLVVNTRPVINKVIENLELDYTYSEMVSKIEVNNPTDSRFLQITVSDPDPKLAQEIADEIAVVTAERVSEKMGTDAPNIVEEANLPGSPSSPNMKRNILIGAVLGLILAAGTVCLIHTVNDTVRSADDVERYFGLTVLASVPLEKREGRLKAKKRGADR